MSFSSLRLLAYATGLAVVLATGALLIFGSTGGSSTVFPTPVDDAAVVDPARIERGRYLAVAGNCASCHTAGEDGHMAGGLAFETDFGTIYSTNITPDPDTGIGRWSADEFLRSMRHGLRPDGEHLYPVFPYTSFTRMADDDVLDLFAYLRSLPPVARVNRRNDLAFPYNLRALLGIWKMLYLDTGPRPEDPARSAEWNRGAYLVEALAHCGECHSPRNGLGAKDSARAMSGGWYYDKVPGGGTRRWSAPNLTSSAAAGLGAWPAAELADYLKTGRNAFVETFGPMNEVIVNSTRHLRVGDIDAMAAYLKSLAPIEDRAGDAADERVLGMGRTQYNLHCGTCHLPTGLGDPEMAPRLNAGSLVVRANDPASLINVILYGPEPPALGRPSPWRKPMDEFQYLLNDDEVAALATFVRQSWDNNASPVSADQVATQR